MSIKKSFLISFFFEMATLVNRYRLFMKKTILLSYLSLIPFSLTANAMELPSESGDGYLKKRESVTVTPEELEHLNPQVTNNNAAIKSEESQRKEFLLSNPSSASFSLDLNTQLAKNPQ